MQTYSRIITHVYPHLDEIVAIRLLKRHGNTKYPGIKDAKIEYVSTGVQPEGKTWKEHMEAGTLLVGTGGGPFDEHPTLETERVEGHSACLLVAKDLGLETHVIYKRLIELVTEADLTRVHEFHIANRLKTRYRLNPKDPQKGIDMVNILLDDWEHEQQLFVDARKHLQTIVSKNELYKAPLPDGSQIGIAVVESDNYKMSAAARSLRIAMLVLKNSDGHMQIFCDLDRHNFSMKKIMGKIRKAECVMTGMSVEDIQKIPTETFEKEGKIPEASQWFYQVPGENILNGAESAPDVPPTQIPLNIIIEIVQKNILILPR